MATILIIIGIIGYLVIGLLVFKIEKGLDNRNYRILKETFGEDGFDVSLNYSALTKNNEHVEEYYRRTNWVPKNVTKTKLIVGCITALIILILWPAAAIVSPIWNYVVFKQIMKKAETPG